MSSILPDYGSGPGYASNSDQTPGYPATQSHPGYPGGHNYPGGPGGPPPSNSKTPLLIAGVVVFLALLGAATVLLLPGDAEAGEVFLVPAASAGPDPFSDTPFAPPPDPALAQPAVASRAPVAAPAGGAPVTATSGAQPGLYGGTRNAQACDPAAMVTFLAANPDKATAWVAALATDPDVRLPDGQPLTTATIPTYVADLTSITLIQDTRVTNHGFKNGRQTVLQSVLQKGSAVMVDGFGVPRVKCYCGNPLLPPVPTSRTPVYSGPRWPDFDAGRVSVVQRSPTPITVFVVVDPATGSQIQLTPGASGVATNGSYAGTPSPSGQVPGSGRLVHDSGEFSIALPANGWGTKTDGRSATGNNAPIIAYSPDVAAYSAGQISVPGFTIIDLAATGMSPTQYIDTWTATLEFQGCPVGPAEPFSSGRFTGIMRRQGPCPQTAAFTALEEQRISIGATASDGSQVALNIKIPTSGGMGIEQIARAALDSFSRP